MQRRLVAAEDRVQDPRGRVDFVQRRLEAVPLRMLHLRGNAVTKLPHETIRTTASRRRGVVPHSHNMRRLSCGRIDGVAATWDAIVATASLSS